MNWKKLCWKSWKIGAGTIKTQRRIKIKRAIIILMLLLTVSAGVAGVNLLYPVKYLNLISESAGKLKPSFVCAVINTESRFRPLARSPKGAGGLMQLTADTARWMAETMGINYNPDDIWEPSSNIAIGCYFLQWLEDYYKGDVLLALCAYNAGIGNVNRWLSDPRYSSDGKTLLSIPFPETAEYVKRIAHNQKVYDFLLKVYDPLAS